MANRKTFKKTMRKYRKKSMVRIKKNFPTMSITSIKRKCLKYDAFPVTPGQITLAFSLSDLPQSSDFTNLFDFYRLCGVKLMFIYQANSNDTGTGIASQLPILHYIADNDDNIGFPNENTALEKEGIKTRRLDKPFTYYLTPRVTPEVFNNGITTGYMLGNKKQWLDCNSPAITHFGLKAWLQCGSNSQNLKIYATYYLQFKGVQ